MPVLFKMSDDRKTEDTPTVVFAETLAAVPPRKTKKYVIIAVTGILSAVIILAAILVGMYIFTEAQKEIIKYTVKLGHNIRQDVISDQNENVVQYHVTSPSQETWIVNDFNKDIQVVKIATEDAIGCFLTPLNRANASDPTKITGPGTEEVKDVVSLTYRASETPIKDTSILGKTAREMCKGVPVYWLHPQCNQPHNSKNSNVTTVHPKTKRQTIIDYVEVCIESDGQRLCLTMVHVHVESSGTAQCIRIDITAAQFCFGFTSAGR